MRAAWVLGLAVPASLAMTGLSYGASGKEPPSCAAISFRAVPSGLGDGTQDAGLYKSRFGRLELKATVKAGEAQDYFLEVDGKQPAALSGPLPKSIATCAESKKLPAPGSPAQACTGEQFRVAIDHSGKQRVFALYGRQGKSWHFCRAGSA